MASSFMGLYVQRDGINLAQKALDLTGSNLSNTHTPGYTRQRMDIVSVKNDARTLGYINQKFLAGAGADSPGISQTRDAILDTKFRRYTSIVENYSVKSEVMSDVEDAIDDIENDETGFAAAILDFKAAFQSFSSTGTNQNDVANVTLNAAHDVVNVLKNFNMRINSISSETLADTEATIGRINEILEQCAALNENIKAGYVNNGNVYETGYTDEYKADVNYGPLELKDNMHLLIDELSGYSDLSVTEETDGTFTIYMAGKTVVQNNEYAKVSLQGNTTFELGTDGEYVYNDDRAPTKLTFSISNLNKDKSWRDMRCLYEGSNDREKALVDKINQAIQSGDFDIAKNAEDLLAESAKTTGGKYERLFECKDLTDTISQGEIKGFLDCYNGAGYYAEEGGNRFEGVEFYKKTIDALAESLVKEFHDIYSKYNENKTGGEDFRLFDFEKDSNGDPIKTAGTIKVADVWEKNPIGCVHPFDVDSETLEDKYKYNEIANDWVNRVTSVFETKHQIGKDALTYRFEDFVNHYGNMVGSGVESANKMLISNKTLLVSAQDARDEVSKVSTDEEGINMLTYQKWYNSMARMMTALDEALDKLINNTGRVGL